MLMLLLKGLMPLVQLLETCRQSKDSANSIEKGKLIKLVLDSITLLAQANVELNSRCRAMIKPDLNEKFQQICGEHVPVTAFLFGDDVDKTLQDIASTNRVSQNVAAPARHTSFQPQFHHKHSKNGRGSSGPTTTTSHGKKRGQLQVTEPVTLNLLVSNNGSYNYVTATPFKAGRLKYFSAAWSKITSDPWILEAIQGVKIEFQMKPFQRLPPRELNVSYSEGFIVDREINKLLQKGVIEQACPDSGEFIPTFFLRPTHTDFIQSYFEFEKIKSIC